MTHGRTCLLLRTHRFGPMEQAFLERLRRESGFLIAVVADETTVPLNCDGFPKISVTRRAVRQLGLHCPRDFTWRCGDYGLYLARRAMPQIEHFWQIEPDVRFAYPDYGDLFRMFDPYPDVDLIGFDLRLAGPDHWWQPTMLQRTRDVYRCLFGLTRFSARALDVCATERRRDSYNIWARLVWPNDETFTSTTLIAAGMKVKDANAFGRRLYTPESFSYWRPFRGETFDDSPQDGLVYHPVVWGEDYDRRIARLRRHWPLARIRMKVLKLVMVEGYHRRLGLGGILARPRPVVRPPPSASDSPWPVGSGPSSHQETPHTLPLSRKG
jgi:hypothetical protein